MNTGKEKVAQICNLLRKETLEPAKKEADEIVGQAKEEAQKILADAKGQSEAMITQASDEIDKKQKVFTASLNQGARQSLEWLRQEIEQRVLNNQLAQVIGKSTADPKMISEMLKVLIGAIESDGLDANLSATVAASVDPKAVAELMGKDLVDRLKEKGLLVGSQKGGVMLKLHDEKITIDLSDQTLLELMVRFVSEEFRHLFFASR